MAAGRHNLTRRALLGAAVGARTLLSRGAAPAAAPRAPWVQALAAFRGAEARLACLDATATDDLFGDLECARLDALRFLICAPAPDLCALSLKIDLTADEEVATLTDAEPCFAALKADAWRLAYGR